MRGFGAEDLSTRRRSLAVLETKVRLFHVDTSTSQRENEMRVRNLNGENQSKYSGATLLAHWERFSRQVAYRCFVIGCKNKSSTGGHVQKDSPTDRNWFVVPLCEECNSKAGQDVDIWDMAKLVPANERKPSRMSTDTAPIRAPRTVNSLS
jgi:hypothetical protein